MRVETGWFAIFAAFTLTLLLQLTAETVRVKDINLSDASSPPQELVNLNGTVFFRAFDPATGWELWKSDGTEVGTALVRDINPGTNSSTPGKLVNVNGTLYFTASDSAGTELWKSDGTTGGTVMVKDIRAGSLSSSPTALVNVSGTLMFAASDGISGTELWKSDGTAAGTVLVKDIRAGVSSSSPASLINVGGIVFFVASDGVSGGELWKSDGTGAGTVMVKDIYPGSSSGISSSLGLINVGGTVFFSGSDGVSGFELWKSDGTEAGTVRVKDIASGSSGSFPTRMANVGGTLFFAAIPSGETYKLWKSDGTEAGTVQLGTVREPQFLVNISGTVFFSAGETAFASDAELWKSDGTESGTVRVKDIWPGNSGSMPASLINVNGTLFFTADDGMAGGDLWKSDGTEAGTVLVKNILSGKSKSAFPSPWDPVFNGGDTLFLAANDGVSGTELWRSDGTDAGTWRVKDIRPGFDSSNPSGVIDINGTRFFAADDGASGVELWKTDGTEAGTILVKDIFAGTNSSTPAPVVNVNGTLFFTANDGVTGRELWKSDGTDAGTVLVKDIRPGILDTMPEYFVNVNGTLFFTANDGVTGRELWKSDGTTAGTVVVKDIYPGSSGGIPESLPGLVNVGGTVFFSNSDGISGHELWKSDGTGAGTVLVKDIAAGVSGSDPSRLADVNGTLFFAASDGGSGFELWKSDGTASGTVRVKDIVAGSGSSYPDSLVNVNGTLFFRAYDPSAALWKSDGTEAGTIRITNVSNLTDPRNLNGTLFFSQSATGSGQELWRSDGTQAGTILVADILPGSGGSVPNGLVVLGGRLFFTADDGITGRELWVHIPDTAPAFVVQPQSQIVVCASNATFTVTASGTPPPAYQWYKGGLPILGATDSSLALTDVQCGDSGSFSVIVSNVAGSITSNPALLTLSDAAPPTIACPTDLVVSTAAGQCSAVVNYAVTATDDCGVTNLLVSPPSGSTFPKGTNTVLCAAIDCFGNTNQCSFAVVVLDTEPPMITCHTNMSVPCTSTNGAQVNFTVTATDNCAPNIVVDTLPVSGSTFGPGSNVVTCTAVDSSGNTNQCVFSITVEDQGPPVLNIMLQGGQAEIGWPVTCTPFVLEETGSLEPPAWTNTAAAPELLGERYRVSVPVDSKKYFRLRN